MEWPALVPPPGSDPTPTLDPVVHGWTTFHGALARYTLHYHGWLHGLAPPQAKRTIFDWIERHPRGVGWEPYPTSLRIMHWLAWLSRHAASLQPEDTRRIGKSLERQAGHVWENLEIRLDGNHLWTNLCGVAAWSLLGPSGGHGPDLTAVSTRLLAAIDRQLERSGLHRERTPTYHCATAEHLAFVHELARRRAPVLARRLASPLARMGLSMAAFTHPDGDVALWGDSQLGASNHPERVLGRLGLAPRSGAILDPGGGFARLVAGPWTVLFNRGDLAMPHQVGHAHADALSLEASLGSERVLVDAGTGGYEPDTDRIYARSTRAHNTATLGPGSPSQHEMWASHRIGGRARIDSSDWSPRVVGGSVRGWRASSTHERRIDCTDDAVRVVDRAFPAVPMIVRYHLPGDVEVASVDGRVHVRTASGLRFTLSHRGANARVHRTAGWTAIGTPRPRICIELATSSGWVETTLRSPLGQ